MKFKFKRSVFGCAMFVALISVLLGDRSAEAQCNVEQIYKLLPNDGAAGDYFGHVAIYGTTAIVGAHWADANGDKSGSAYLFDTTTGQQIRKLLPDDGAPGDVLGLSVAIDGTVAIVGASGDDNENGENSGSAYLFDTMTGQQITKLLPLDGAADNWFGHAVAIDGTTAIVGAYNGGDSGSAYVFDATTGQQTFKLVPNDGGFDNRFGYSVGISGTTAIVGAYWDDDNGYWSGSAYLFDTTTGQQIAKLLPDDGAAEDFFGLKVAISGNTAIVSAPRDNDNGIDSGSAYLFDTTTGEQLLKLLPDDGAEDDHFGDSVSISGTTAIMGAHNDDDNGINSGSAYLFDTTTGAQFAKLLPDDDGAAGDGLGWGVAIGGTTAIVGATGDDDNGEDSGSAYLFDVSSCVDTEVVNASQYTVYRGFHIAGDLSDSFESDDSYIKFNPGMTINSSEAPVWLIFDGTLPSDSPVSLQIVMESNVGTPGLTHTLEAWNWTSAAYDVVDVSTASFNDDVVVTVDLSSQISDYAQAGTGAVRTRVGWRKTGPTINYPWEIRLDQMVWLVE